MSAMQLQRCLKIGAMVINDTSPELDFDSWIRSLVQRFPQLRTFRLYPEDGKIEGTKLVYELDTPPPKTKG